MNIKSPKEMSRVIGSVTKKFLGKASGKIISDIVKRILI